MKKQPLDKDVPKYIWDYIWGKGFLTGTGMMLFMFVVFFLVFALFTGCALQTNGRNSFGDYDNVSSKQCRLPVEVSFNDSFNKPSPHQINLIRESLRWWELRIGTLLFVEVPFMGTLTFENTDIPYFGYKFGNTKNFLDQGRGCIISSQIVFHRLDTLSKQQQEYVIKREIGYSLGFTDEDMMNMGYVF